MELKVYQPTVATNAKATGNYEDSKDRVRIDPDKERKLTERLVGALKELEIAEEEKRQETKRLGERVKELKETANRLAEYIRSGWEEVSVPCQWWHNYTNGEAELRREDTGGIVTSRRLDADERQLRLTVEDETHLLPAIGRESIKQKEDCNE
ncbi:MAG: hypothetical protein JNJ94_00225 [Chlorobi bacterium]|nr:hypothetical protein [Chlorobiota bacterium]